MRVRSWGPVATPVFSLAGLVLGHSLAYLLAHPGAQTRHEHLASAAHGWLHSATWLLTLLVPLAIAAVTRRARDHAPAWSSVATRLLALQAGAFLFAELAERGFDLTRAFAEPAVGIGLVLQAAIALLLAFSLGVVAEVARAIARRSNGYRTHRHSAPWARPAAPVRSYASAVLLLAAPRRGPPFAVAT